ncbi:FAD-dependent oxidoreductase [Xinfangfangia sp. CPCC 101601]|uniref:FAD-dependent oxidoreductase n=1 Tax=Pseudogemmobacter lacusdianii TaxID=3069608 RepID=A0ABU0W2W6_9RHOB|nr:FAD-dependent oxidoreductase [Xinfangfangia sp. CPCC 101601]MDQ2067795.1 FAD-dependent oxidoreductase [Xinfangfangia sp. CPCC 101601]
MKSEAKVVIIGGGAVGASVLYHLSKQGCTDVVLLDRSKLTSGSTWHAAGLLVSYSRSRNITKMTKETIDIYKDIQKEHGASVGLYQVGQLRIANTQERMDEFQSYIGIAEAAGNEARLVTPEEIKVLHPLLAQNANIIGGLFHPNDGYINPSDITMAMAKLAREKGATVEEDTEAQAYEQLPDGRWKVTTNKGEIIAEQLVFATGNYARENARRVGLDLPCMPILHQYWTTEPLPELLENRKNGVPQYPILRDEDYGGYLREDTGGLQFGPYEFEKDLKVWAVDRVPPDFGMDLLPEDFDAVETQWSKVFERIPAIGSVGIKSNTRGPFQMTPDGAPLVGPAPGLAKLWLAEGVPGGIAWGGTIGHRLALWILNGDPGMDCSEVDPRRFGNHVSKRWTMEKARQTWGVHMEVHYPGEDRPAARAAKTSPAYDLLTAKGAVWSALDGWEFPRWFAPSPELAVPQHSFRRTKQMEYVQAEVRAVRETAGLIEMAAMTQFLVKGPGAAVWLDGLFANNLPKVGRIGLTVMCKEDGGIIAEYTVMRLAEDAFYLVSTPSGEVMNWHELSRLLPTDGSVTLQNLSEQMGVISLSGPKSREILQPLTDNDLSSEAFPWLSIQKGEVGYARDIWLARVSYTGEMGWELHYPLSYGRHLIDLLIKAGEPHGMKLFGLDAIESLRLDKSYRSMRRELAWDVTPLEASLDRFVKLDKDFIGRDAIAAQKAKGLSQKLVTLKLPNAVTSVIANEGVYKDGKLVGRVTSGGWSYHFGHDIALALVETAHTPVGTELKVWIHDEMRDATVIADSPYDPTNARQRA